MRRSGAVVAFLCSWLAAAAGARADGTYVKEGGGTVVPLPNGEVRLVDETIDIAVERDGLLAPDDTLTVTVTYRFRHLTDRKVALSMGFPVGWDTREQYAQAEDYLDRERRCPVSDFAATVDGAPAAVRPKPPRVPPLRPLAEPWELEEAQRREGVPDPFGALQYFVWRVSFGPRQERTVVNRFRYDASAGVYWDENLFRYVLRSGAAWAGVIERATVRLRLGDRGCLRTEGPDSCIAGLDELAGFRHDPFEFAAELPPGITPAGGRLVAAADRTLEVVWELAHLDPEEDIAFGYETARTARLAVRAAIGALDLAAADDVTLAEARDTLLALHGVRFADPATQARFAARSWYVVDPAMTPEGAAARDELLPKLTAALAAYAPGAPRPPTRRNGARGAP